MANVIYPNFTVYIQISVVNCIVVLTETQSGTPNTPLESLAGSATDFYRRFVRTKSRQCSPYKNLSKNRSEIDGNQTPEKYAKMAFKFHSSHSNDH